MKILILGASGQIPRYLIPMLLSQTDAELYLYARNASQRISVADAARETCIDGDIADVATLTEAMRGVDVVYVNPVVRVDLAEPIIAAMKQSGTKRIIANSILGIYGEVPGAFGVWNRRMIGDGSIAERTESAKLFEDSGLDYTLLRLSWFYDQDGNTRYKLTKKGEPFEGAQITRQAIAQCVVDIIKDTSGRFIGQSLGVGEPDTNFDKPSFY